MKENKENKNNVQPVPITHIKDSLEISLQFTQGDTYIIRIVEGGFASTVKYKWNAFINYVAPTTQTACTDGLIIGSPILAWLNIKPLVANYVPSEKYIDQECDIMQTADTIINLSNPETMI